MACSGVPSWEAGVCRATARPRPGRRGLGETTHPLNRTLTRCEVLGSSPTTTWEHPGQYLRARRWCGGVVGSLPVSPMSPTLKQSARSNPRHPHEPGLSSERSGRKRNEQTAQEAAPW